MSICSVKATYKYLLNFFRAIKLFVVSYDLFHILFQWIFLLQQKQYLKFLNPVHADVEHFIP